MRAFFLQTFSLGTGALLLLLCGAIGITAIESSLYASVQEVLPVHAQVAGASSVSANVDPTPLNTQYQLVQEKDKALTQKEQELRAKEAYLNSFAAPTERTIYTLYIIIAVLSFLVAVNFFFDIRQRRAHA